MAIVTLRHFQSTPQFIACVTSPNEGLLDL
jgi:hypothetical protein